MARTQAWAGILPGLTVPPVGSTGTWTIQGATVSAGNGSPESVVVARVGSLYLRLDGGAGTTLYVKQSGTGNAGWVAK